MSKKCKVNWSDIDGASPKPKRLHLEKDETDSLYHCPIQECDHDGFQSQRGCRKHVNNKHRWFFYFDEKPNSKEITDSLKLASNFPKERAQFKIEQGRQQGTPSSYFPHFHYLVTLAKNLRNG